MQFSLFCLLKEWPKNGRCWCHCFPNELNAEFFFLSSLAPRAIDKNMVRHIQQHEENCGRNTINDLFKRTRTNRRKASNAVYMIMLNANKDYPENKQRFILNKKKEPLVRPTPPSVSVPGPSHQNILGFGTFVKKPTKSGLSHAVLYHIGMQAIYNCHNPFDEVVESEVFKMSITPELARFAKVDNPSELNINQVKSEVRSLISMSAVGDSYFQTH